MRLPLVTFVLLVTAPMGRAQSLVRSVNGPAAGAQFGRSCTVVPDQNADGFKDVLVGAPGFNGGRGAIYCVSGAFLANGAGNQLLWSLAPTAAAGDNFGHSLADIGDVTGDGVHDFVVGQPGYDAGALVDRGAIRLINGASHTAISTRYPTGSSDGLFGWSIAACGDLNQNGVPDVAVGAPFDGVSQGGAYIFDGTVLLQTGSIANQYFSVVPGGSYGDQVGISLASGADLNGDGRNEVITGCPFYSSNGPGQVGRVIIKDVAANQTVNVEGSVSVERFGASVSIGHDYDGDGVADLLVGAPNSNNGTMYEVGRVAVLSGARVMAQQLPYEIYSFAYGPVTPPATHSDPLPNMHFGAAVLACPDLNNDGVGEIMVGAPGYFSQGFTTPSFRGLVRVFSGATGSLLCAFTGATTDKLGDALGGSVGDLDGDGFPEFIAAGSLSDAGGTDSGVVRCYRLFPLLPNFYCIGKMNSLGCVPYVNFVGTPDANSGQPFTITGNNFLNHKAGLLFYSRAPSAVPFQGGTKCAASPVVRTGVQDSGGSPTGSDCTGTYSLDFNARIASGVDPALVAGVDIYAQFWSRDPASPSTTSLSNALHFVIHP